ncbi:MAG: spondin domain-containing protein [Halioglobus sp.]
MKRLIAVSTVALLAACSNGNNNNPVVVDPVDPTVPVDPPAPPPPADPGRTFEVSVTNLTVAQPFSPVGIFLHDSSQQVFSVGTPASEPLEMMAEGGDISGLIAAVDSISELSGDAPIGPGGSTTYTISIDAQPAAELELSVMTMLVNTNDGFTGVNGADITALEEGQSMSFNAIAYDSGTENNTEAAGTMPGPADGGEGFNAVRDDINDQVTMHSGVVTASDGLASSVLNQLHRFDNPVARVRITRTQ